MLSTTTVCEGQPGGYRLPSPFLSPWTNATVYIRHSDANPTGIDRLWDHAGLWQIVYLTSGKNRPCRKTGETVAPSTCEITDEDVLIRLPGPGINTVPIWFVCSVQPWAPFELDIARQSIPTN